MSTNIEFEDQQGGQESDSSTPAPEQGGRQRLRSAKRYACVAVRNLHLESGKVMAGDMCRLTDDEIYRFEDAVKRLRPGEGGD